MTPLIEDEQSTENAAIEWNRFVVAQPDAHYCHLFEWSRVFERAYGTRAFRLVSRGSEGIEGVLALSLIRGPARSRRLVSLPYLDRGGPLGSGPQAHEDVIEQGKGLATALRVPGVELRDWKAGEGETLETARHRYVLTLSQEPEQLWKELNGKVRNQIRKAEKGGLSTRRSDVAGLQEFFSVFASNMRDLGSPTHSALFFEEILRSVPGASLYLSRDGSGDTVAGAIAIRFRDSVCVPWASSLRSARSLCPNHSLYWQVLSDAVDEGAVSFDFGRSWKDSGPARFKLQWGAEPQPLFWTELRGEEPARFVGTEPPAAQSRAAALWQRLPLPIATALGSRIRPYLAS